MQTESAKKRRIPKKVTLFPKLSIDMAIQLQVFSVYVLIG